MKRYLMVILAVCAVCEAGLAQTPMEDLRLTGDADGGGHSFTNLADVVLQDGTRLSEIEPTVSTDATLTGDGTAGDPLGVVSDIVDGAALGATALQDVTGEAIGDLSDVSAATPSKKDALLWDGVDSWTARALVEADISDFGTYLTEETDPRLPAHSTSGNLLQSDGNAWTSWTPDYITGVDWDDIGGDQSDVLVSGFDNDAGFTDFSPADLATDYGTDLTALTNAIDDKVPLVSTNNLTVTTSGGITTPNMIIETGVGVSAGGNLTLRTGGGSDVEGFVESGDILIETGYADNAAAGNAGNITLRVLDAMDLPGNVTIRAGKSGEEAGGEVTIEGGESLSEAGGDIILRPGVGETTGGKVRVEGDMSATGTVTAVAFVGDGSGLTGIIASITDAGSLTNSYAWTPAVSGDLLWAALDAAREITINAPTATNVPIRATVALVQDGGDGQVTWAGPVAAPGGIAPSMGSEDGDVDYFGWQWDGSRWVFFEASYSVEDL